MNRQSSNRWAGFRPHDPGHIGLRRGIRAAVALPASLAIAMYVIHDTSAAAFAGFGAVGLLMTADYAGSALQRTIDYVVTGVLVSGLIGVGLVISGNPVSAAIGTFAIAFITSIAAMLRGSVATGAPAALLMFIVAVCIGASGTSFADALAAWWVAVVVCTVVALIVLPRQRVDLARKLLARVCAESAAMARSAWLDPLDEVQVRAQASALDRTLSELRGIHAGKPFRPSGLTQKERMLSLLIDHAWGMREVVRNPNLHDSPTAGTGYLAQKTKDLAGAVVETLSDCATGLRDRGHIPTVDRIVAARTAFLEATATTTLTAAQAGATAADLARDIQSRHLVGVASTITEQTAQLVREVNGLNAQSLDGALNVPQRPATTFVRSQVTLESAWMRNALRSAFGLAIAMVLVNVTNVQDGFWVLLGVIAVLRFDSFTTRRNAWQALLGTGLGVVAASVVIIALGQHLTVMWMLLPIAVFVAGWSAVAWNFPIAQASFTGFVLIMVAITKWPPTLLTGEFRVIDVALGALIAVAVALVMWPQGAAGVLSTVMAKTVRRAWGFTTVVLNSYAMRISAARIDEGLGQARRAILTSSETYDIAIMQRGPGSPPFEEWLAVGGDCYLLVNLARTMAPYGQGPLPAGWSPSLMELIQQRGEVQDSYWSDVATRIANNNLTEWGAPPIPCSWESLREAPRNRDEALGFTVTVWFLDWIDRIDVIRSTRRKDQASTP